MWKNVVETNIMVRPALFKSYPELTPYLSQVGTHADSLIAEAVLKNITGFDRELAWEAVWKDATVAPKNDGKVVYDDREEVGARPSPIQYLVNAEPETAC